MVYRRNGFCIRRINDISDNRARLRWHIRSTRGERSARASRLKAKSNNGPRKQLFQHWPLDSCIRFDSLGIRENLTQGRGKLLR